MLIATITALILIFGGGGLEFYLTDLKKPVKEHVEDKVRREAVLETGTALEKDLKAMQKEIERHFRELIRMHSVYDSTPADYDAAGGKLKDDQKKMADLVLNARDRMHEQMTREEWNAVFSPSE